MSDYYVNSVTIHTYALYSGFYLLNITYMNKKYVLGAMALIVLIAVIAGYSEKERGSNVVIGALLPETGFGAYWGAPVRKGAELAVKDLKEKHGDHFSLIIEDSRSDAKTAVSGANKLISVDKADALYTEFSGISSAVSPIAKENDKVLIYSTFNQKILEDNKKSIKTFISYDVVCNELLKNIPKNSKVHILSTIADAAPYCKSALLKELPEGNIKVTEGLTGIDFRTLLLQQKQNAYDYLIPITYEDGYYALIKQKNELQIAGSIFCYKADCYTEKIKSELPQSYLSGLMYFEVSIDSAFRERITKLFPDFTEGDISASANAYQSIFMAGQTLYECKKDTECAIKKMSNKTLENKGYSDARVVNRNLESNILIERVK